MHSLFVPNIALFPTYLSFVFFKFSHCAHNFRFRQQIKLTNKTIPKTEITWKFFRIQDYFRQHAWSWHKNNNVCWKLAKDGHNLVFTGQCGTGKTHLLRCLFIYKFGYSNSWRLMQNTGAIQHFNLPIWSVSQKNFMITSLFGKC